MKLTIDERKELLTKHPRHYFARVVRGTATAIIAIPKPKAPLKRGGFFDCPEIFHGATIHIREST